MKLLLDEMFSPEIAEQLRTRGHDVVAVAEDRVLRMAQDPTIFAAAQREGRTIVTENAGDFRALANAALQRGESHAGLILTSNRQFSRHDPRTLGRIVTALNDVLHTHATLSDSEHWLIQ
jgi:predicted nuclease of predicted toxin-antitoxin system